MTGDTGDVVIPSNTHRPVKLDGIQIVRALAASLVVADHSLLTVGNKDKELAWLMGAVGVWLFFIISGVIMYHTTAGSRRGPYAAKMFITKRIIRIVPLYWIFTLLLVAQTLVRARDMRLEWVIKSMLFVPYYDSEGQIHPIVQQGWTLSFEMIFYVIFTLSLLFKRRVGILFVLSALSLLATLSLAPLSMPLKAWFDPVVILFGIGIIVAMLYKHIKFSVSIRPYLSFLVLGGTILIVLLLRRMPSYPPSFLSHCLAWLACATIVMIALYITQSSGYLARSVEALGDASYSTYLCHNIIIYPIFKLIGHKLGADLAVFVMVIAANVAGLVIYRLIEKPLNKQIRAGGDRALALRRLNS